jgi:hypothetical protein
MKRWNEENSTEFCATQYKIYSIPVWAVIFMYVPNGMFSMHKHADLN